MQVSELEKIMRNANRERSIGNLTDATEASADVTSFYINRHAVFN